MTESKQLKKMQKFLHNLGLDSKINDYDGKLYCLDIKEYHDEIIQKSKELGVIFTMEQTPYYGPVDPITLQRDIVGFSRSYYFEDGDVE